MVENIEIPKTYTIQDLINFLTQQDKSAEIRIEDYRGHLQMPKKLILDENDIFVLAGDDD